MKKEDKELLLLSAKCLIQLYITLQDNPCSDEEYYKELAHMKEAAEGLLNDSRKNNLVIPKQDRLVLYEILKS